MTLTRSARKRTSISLKIWFAPTRLHNGMVCIAECSLSFYTGLNLLLDSRIVFSTMLSVLGYLFIITLSSLYPANTFTF